MASSSSLAFKVVLHRDAHSGYWAEVPQLKGCYSQGNTRKEALENIQEAIELYIHSVGVYKPRTMKKNEVELHTVLVDA